MSDGIEYSLSTPELNVLELVVEGLADKEIALKLGISVCTVNKHLSRIMTKMSARSRTEAAVKAIRQEIVVGPWQRS